MMTTLKTWKSKLRAGKNPTAIHQEWGESKNKLHIQR